VKRIQPSSGQLQLEAHLAGGYVIKPKAFRICTALAVAVAIALSAVLKVGTGTPCSFGIGGISTICPLGAAQLLLAGRKAAPQLLVALGATLLGVVLFGRLFCAWVCPTSLLRAVFQRRSTARPGRAMSATSPVPTDAQAEPPVTTAAPSQPSDGLEPWLRYSRYALLAGTLVASLLFRFPVFCLVCPVGLFFGTVFAILRLFQRQQASLELLLYPAMLAAELTLLRDWCRSLCPLGLLLGAIGTLSPVGRPAVDKEKCLAARGVDCRVCQRVCPQHIDLKSSQGLAHKIDCTRCLECYDRCPVGAIAAWPLKAPRRRPGRRHAKGAITRG